MDGSPCLYKTELLHRKTSCKKLTVNTHRGFILCVKHMEMRLVVLSVIVVQHLDEDVIESA
jgi:hypothetical protein